MTAAKKHAPNPRRAELKALSAEFRPLVKAGVYSNVNAALVDYYSRQVGCPLDAWHTFADWRKAGTPVKKGETGFPIWAQPRKLSSADAVITDGAAALAAVTGTPLEEMGPEFFPVCYLFHAGQVEARAVNPTRELFPLEQEGAAAHA